jgi:haloacetate dehalogenase
MRFDEFEELQVTTPETSIFLRRGGSGPALVLLHGFPETHLMWRDVAPLLAERFTVICPDLRGYGRSGCPPSSADHAAYSKRSMGSDVVAIVERLGHERVCLVGHDRGGRVAYRTALDYPERVSRLAVLDILPVSEVWARADKNLALGYWPWSLLAQREPLPERLIAAAPAAVVDNALHGWGSSSTAFSAEVRSAYIDALRDPAHVHAICEEYRAAAAIDCDHDECDRAKERKIKCPVLVLWSRSGPLGTWYQDYGGPLGLWSRWAEEVDGTPLNFGHFFPEEAPRETADLLMRFLEGSAPEAHDHQRRFQT